MNRIFKTAVLATTLAATMLAVLPAAQAGDGWRRHHGRHGDGDLVAAGVLGLAVGALAAGVATSNDRVYVDEPSYREPVSRPHPYRGYDEPVYVDRDYVDEPDVVYVDRRAGAEPWSRGWFRYCENRYRSFDARKGTFVGYDGAEHFCVAN